MKVDFAQLYVKGARVWIADKQLVWRGAKLAEDLDQEKADFMAKWRQNSNGIYTRELMPMICSFIWIHFYIKI